MGIEVKFPSRPLSLLVCSTALVFWGCQDQEPVLPPFEAPAPALSVLSVDGGEALNPAFSPEINRYSVVASDSAGENLTIVALGEAGLEITVEGESVSLMEPFSRQVSPGSTIEILVRNQNGSVRTYTVEYLPSDFPRLRTESNREAPSSGLTYITLSEWLIVIDDNGVPVFYKRESNRVTDFKLHPSGERSYAVRTGYLSDFGMNDHEIVVLDADFEEIDRVTTIGLNQTDNHDFLIRENGNYVLLSYHGETRDLTDYGGGPADPVIESVMQEITRDRELVFQWRSWPEIPWSERLRDKAEYAHVNSVFETPDGDFILSLRRVSQVVKVDRSTGQVAWKLGGMSNEFEFKADPFSNICAQHTASLLPGGRLLLFDNGQLCWPIEPSRGELTRVVEYDLDEEAMTATMVWSYSRPDTYSRSMGSSQRLSNGNTLISWGNRPAVTATEVNAQGEVVWELFADSEKPWTYRAFRAER